MKSARDHAVTAAIALVAGGVGALLSSTLAASSGEPAAASGGITIVRSNDGQPLAEVEIRERERLRLLAMATGDGGVDRPRFTAEEAEAMMRSPELQFEAARQFNERLLTHFRAEPSNADFASEHVPAVQSELNEMQDDFGFIARSVECRSSACLAHVTWPTYLAAQQHDADLVHHHYSLNCARSIFLPRPSEEGAPYDAQLMIYCNEEEFNRR